MSTESLSDHAYRHIHGKLLAGELPAGRVLSELSLAREIGISRTPVREAIKRLETSGVDFALMAANAPHHRFAAITQGTKIPVINLLDVVAKTASQVGAKQVLILGTALAMRSSKFREVFSRYGIAAAGPVEEAARPVVADRRVAQVRSGQPLAGDSIVIGVEVAGVMGRGASRLDEGGLRRALGRERCATRKRPGGLARRRRELAWSHDMLGNVLSDLGKPEEAEAAYRQALDIKEKLAAAPKEIATRAASEFALEGLVPANEAFERKKAHLSDNKVDTATAKGLVGVKLTIDPKAEKFSVGDNLAKANEMLFREYRKGFDISEAV